MPRLPDVPAMGERPIPQAGGGVVSYRPTTGAETAPGEAVFKAGDTLRQTGGAMESEYARQDAEQRRKAAEEKAIKREAAAEQEKIDQTRAEGAFNDYRTRQLDLTMGEQNGFVNRRGQQALSAEFLTEYRTRLTQAGKEVEAGLANDQQRAFFQKRAAISAQQFETDLLRHRLQEDDKYRTQVFEGTMTTERMQATSRWQDPAAVAFSLARIDDAIRSEGERRGWSPEMAEGVRLEQRSKVHTGVVSQALAVDNYQFAQAWFDRYKGEMSPEASRAVQNAVTDAAQKSLSAVYQRSFLDNKDNGRALAALETQVSKDTTLDENRKNAILGRIMGQRDILERRAIAAQERQSRLMEREIDRVNSLTLQGYEPGVDEMLPLLNATKGTELEPKVRQMIAVANSTREFRGMSPREQEAYIMRLDAEVRKAPTKFDVTTVSRFRSIYESQKQQVKDSPVTFAVRQGLVPATDPAAQPLDLTKPDAIGPQLQARVGLARQMQSRYGGELKPLTTEETRALTDGLRKASPEQKSAYIGQLMKSSGDPQGFMAIMGQIAPDSPTTAIAGSLAARGDGKGAALVVRGESYLNPPRKEDGSPVAGGKLVKVPDDKEFLKVFSAETGKAFAGRPGQADAHLQAIRATYAALATDAGLDPSITAVDTKLFRQAFKTVVGEVEKYRGKEIILPREMNFSAFRTALADRVDDLVASGRLDPTMTRDRVLSLPAENRGDGKYVLGAGDSVLVDKAGQLIVIDVAAPSETATKRPSRPNTLDSTRSSAARGLMDLRSQQP